MSSDFEITLDGERVALEPRYRPGEEARAGDLVSLGLHAFELRQGDEALELVSETNEWGHGTLHVAGSRTPFAGAIAKSDFHLSTMDTLSREERLGLRSVRVHTWIPATAELLSETDPERCAYLVSGFDPADSAFNADTHFSLPPVPLAARHLILRQGRFGPKLTYDWRGLGGLPELETLTAPASFDAPSLLARSSQLWALRWPMIVGGPEAFAELSQVRSLRYLDLPYFKAEDLAPLRELEDLETLSLGKCDMAFGLAPLAGLPRLRRLTLGLCPLEGGLPLEGFEGLEALDLLGCAAISPEEVEAFRRKHPTCAVRHDWTEDFLSRARGANRIRVRTGGTCHRNPSTERTLTELDATRTQELLEAFTVEPETSSCRCCGTPSLDFLSGDEVLASLGCHHGRHLRWSGWPADASPGLALRRALNRLVPSWRSR